MLHQSSLYHSSIYLTILRRCFSTSYMRWTQVTVDRRQRSVDDMTTMTLTTLHHQRQCTCIRVSHGTRLPIIINTCDTDWLNTVNYLIYVHVLLAVWILWKSQPSWLRTFQWNMKSVASASGSVTSTACDAVNVDLKSVGIAAQELLSGLHTTASWSRLCCVLSMWFRQCFWLLSARVPCEPC